jgi:FixJ family two-component response regulator
MVNFANDTGSSQRTIIRILDDDSQVLGYLAHVVRAAGYEAEAFSNPHDFLNHQDGPAPACLIVDWQLQGQDGLEILAQCQERWPRTPAILVSGHMTVPVTVTAMRQGVVGVLQKPIRPDELLREIGTALEWSRRRGEEAEQRAQARRRVQELGDLELAILKLLVDGTPNKNIATQTHIAIRTVEKYRRIVFDKLGVDSAAEATRVWVLANMDD